MFIPCQLIEQEKMEQLAKERQKVLEVVHKAQNVNEEFSKKTKEKLQRSMEIRRENRENQIKALQERLREHVRIFVVCPLFKYVCEFHFSCLLL